MNEAAMKVTPCFVDETGALRTPKQPLFPVGLLVIREVAELTDRLHTASLNFGDCTLNAPITVEAIEA